MPLPFFDLGVEGGTPRERQTRRVCIVSIQTSPSVSVFGVSRGAFAPPWTVHFKHDEECHPPATSYFRSDVSDLFFEPQAVERNLFL